MMKVLIVDTIPMNTFRHDRPTKAELGTLKKKLAGYISGVTAVLYMKTVSKVIEMIIQLCFEGYSTITYSLDLSATI